MIICRPKLLISIKLLHIEAVFNTRSKKNGRSSAFFWTVGRVRNGFDQWHCAL